MNKQKIRKVLEKKKDYIKTNIWKRFFKYKLYELGIIPVSLLALWQIPLQLGWAFIKIFNINPLTSTWFCKDTGQSAISTICNLTNYDTFKIWGFGIMISLILLMYLVINYKVAENSLQNEADTKYGYSDYELS